MPRHADGNDRSFRSSLLRAAAGGLVALIVTFGITGLLTVLGRDDGTGGPAMVAQPTEQPQSTGTGQPAPADDATVATSDAPPSQDPTPPSQDPTPQEQTESPASGGGDGGGVGDVTVQVLDAVGSGTQAQQAADVLRDLGYDVVVVNPTPRRVDKTTTLATPGSRAEAEALRDDDPRFGVIKKNKDFNQAVDLHVLVGPDFTP